MSIEELNSYNLLSQSNKLIESKYTLNINEQRLIFAMISMINPEDEDFREYRIRISDLAKIIGLKKKNYHAEVKEITKNIIRKTIQIKKETGLLQINWISSAEYINAEGVVVLTFDPKLKPYLLKLKAGFTSTRFGIAVKFKTFYTTRIYQLLKQYEKIGKRTITVDFFKKNFDIYDDYKDIKRRIIEPAKKEINKNSDIKFEYEEKKVGRKVDNLIFRIRKQTYNDELPLNLPPKMKKPLEESSDLKSVAKIMNQKYGISIDLCNSIIAEKIENNKNEDFKKIFTYIDAVLENGKIKNPSGFVVSCIKKSYYKEVSYSGKKESRKEASNLIFKAAEDAFRELSSDEQQKMINDLRESDVYFRSKYDGMGFSDTGNYKYFIALTRDKLVSEDKIKEIEKMIIL